MTATGLAIFQDNLPTLLLEVEYHNPMSNISNISLFPIAIRVLSCVTIPTISLDLQTTATTELLNNAGVPLNSTLLIALAIRAILPHAIYSL